MAKKLIPLTARDIILQADAETIREAYESRVKIDELLVQREEAYRQIEALELQVEELVGEEGIFVYPEPPVPVAGFSKPVPASRLKTKAKPAPEPEPETEPSADEDAAATDEATNPEASTPEETSPEPENNESTN